MLTPSERITKAKIELRKSNKTKFFSYLVSLFKIIETTQVKTACVNAHKVIKYNPKFVEGLKSSQTVFLLAHEVLHYALKHVTRIPKGNHTKSNIAMDLKVNDILISEGIGTTIDEGLNPYNHCYQFQKTQYKVTDIHLKSVEDLYEEIPDEEAEDDSNEFDEHEFDDLKPEELRDLQKELCEAVASQQQGYGSNTLKRLFRDIQEPQVDWKVALGRFTQRFINDAYSWSKPNRRMLSQNLILPGYIKSEKIEGCFVADTSGSMSTKALTAVVSEIKAILSSFSALKIKLLIGDAELTEEHDLDQNFDIATIQMKGGGGTSHRFMYQYLQENNPQFCIAFTDGYSDIKECFQEYDTTTPVMFLVPEQHMDLSDYGEVIEIKADSL